MTNNHTKKSNHPKFFIKIKNMFQKKITSSKNKNKLSRPSPKKSKEKKIRKKKGGNVNAQEKKGATLLPREVGEITCVLCEDFEIRGRYGFWGACVGDKPRGEIGRAHV